MQEFWYQIQMPSINAAFLSDFKQIHRFILKQHYPHVKLAVNRQCVRI